MTTKKTLLEFPCNFPIKIMGNNSPVFLDEIEKIVMKHFPDFEHKNFRHNASKNNKYLAITVTVPAQNQSMLDAFYREVTQHPDVKMVL